MKIAKVIHGFPPYYMAGSEIYSYNLCSELSKKHDVWVFTRIEDPYSPLYEVRQEELDGMRVTRVNKPPRDYTFRSKYEDERMKRVFERELDSVNPDIAHVGHLSHLSTNIIRMLKERGIPVVYTLHDYWLMCLRGQLITNGLELCNGPTPEGCARCFELYFQSKEEGKREVVRWREYVKEIMQIIDFYVAPSNFLRNVFVKSGIPEHKITYLDYGFNTELFDGFLKIDSDMIRFGFLGRIIPVKGIHILMDAFNGMTGEDAELNIYGAAPVSAGYLKNRVKNPRIHFRGPYDNQDVAKVLSNIDALVVPSIWYENSPLVIHEAFLAKIPVIATNLGGMAEYVKHGKNGLLFELGNVDDLRVKMTMLARDPELLREISDGENEVRTIQEDAESMVSIYENLVQK
jgi:glycosyltransferase involved in cell wall biosynthesis